MTNLPPNASGPSSHVKAKPNDDTDLTALRDWFAGQALVGMIPMPRTPGVLSLSIDGMAQVAYQYADALIKARSLAPK